MVEKKQKQTKKYIIWKKKNQTVIEHKITGGIYINTYDNIYPKVITENFGGYRSSSYLF